MCGYKQYDACHSAMNQEHEVPKDSRSQEDKILSEIEDTSGKDVTSY